VTYPVGGVSPLIDEMRRVAEARGKTVPQVAINYVICKGVIPIPGARDAKMAVCLVCMCVCVCVMAVYLAFLKALNCDPEP